MRLVGRLQISVAPFTRTKPTKPGYFTGLEFEAGLVSTHATFDPV